MAVPAIPALPAMPALPAVPAIPIEPVTPAEPGAPAWGNAHFRGSAHWGDGPAADCSDLRIRMNDERPTIEVEERTVTKAEVGVLRVEEVEEGAVHGRGGDMELN